MIDRALVSDMHQPMSAMERNALWLQLADLGLFVDGCNLIPRGQSIVGETDARPFSGARAAAESILLTAPSVARRRTQFIDPRQI